MGHSLTECSEANGRGDFLRKLTLRAAGIKGSPTCRLRCGECAEAIGDTRMEGGVEPFLKACAAVTRLTGEPLLGGKVQEHGEVGGQPRRGERDSRTEFV